MQFSNGQGSKARQREPKRAMFCHSCCLIARHNLIRAQLRLLGWVPPPLVRSVPMSALLSRGGISLVNSAGAVYSVSTGDNTFISAVLVNVALVPSKYWIV